jgi:hypothetical protein
MSWHIAIRSFLGITIVGFAIWTILESYPGRGALSGILNANVIPIYVPATGYVILDDISLATAVQAGDVLGAVITVTPHTRAPAGLPMESFRQAKDSFPSSQDTATKPDVAQAMHNENDKEKQIERAPEGVLGNDWETQIISPLRGRIWSINSGGVEFHESGKKILEIADCSDVFVFSAGSTSSLATVRPGDKAWFRADGERRSWPGIVFWSGSARAVGTMAHPAFLPEIPDDARYGFLIKLDAGPDLVEKCPVGMPGRTIFENYSDRIVSAMKRWVGR